MLRVLLFLVILAGCEHYSGRGTVGKECLPDGTCMYKNLVCTPYTQTVRPPTYYVCTLVPVVEQ